MKNVQLTLTENQIIVERPGSNKNNFHPNEVKAAKDDSSDGSDSYTKLHSNLSSSYSIVNGEGNDGDTDGSESDGDDKRF